MNTAILTTNQTFPDGEVLKPATVPHPSGAVLHLIPRANFLSFFNTVPGGPAPAEPLDALYSPDGILAGKGDRRFSALVNPAVNNAFTLSLVFELDPSTGNSIQIFSNTSSTANQGITVGYFPGVAGGIFQIASRVENAAGVVVFSNQNLAYANTNPKGWVQLVVQHQVGGGVNRVYSLTKEQDGTMRSVAHPAGFGLRTPHSEEFHVGGNALSAAFDDFKVAEVFTRHSTLAISAANNETFFSEAKARLAPIGIDLP